MNDAGGVSARSVDRHRLARYAAFGAVAFLPVLTAYAQRVPAGSSSLPAPLAHWTFDDVQEDKAPDRTGRCHGRLFGKGTLPELVPGMHGKALRFEPGREQYVRVDGFASICPRDQLTAMAWVRVDRRTKMWADIIGYQPEQSRGDKARPLCGFRLWKTWGCDEIRFYLGDGEARAYKEELKCRASGLRRMTDHWMHVAAVWDGAWLRIYINAVERGACEVGARLVPGRTPLIIGNYLHNKAVYPFHGDIDDVRIYDVALEEEQILNAATGD